MFQNASVELIKLGINDVIMMHNIEFQIASGKMNAVFLMLTREIKAAIIASSPRKRTI